MIGKVRAWDVERGEWCAYADYSGWTNEWRGFDKDGHVRTNITVMHYIEADDADGTPIAEGDIMQHRARPEFSGIVRFAKGGFFCVGKTKTDDRKEVWSGSFMEHHCVVRGNAYQNPELMDWFQPEPPEPQKRLPRSRKVIDAEIVEQPKKRGKK